MGRESEKLKRRRETERAQRREGGGERGRERDREGTGFVNIGDSKNSNSISAISAVQFNS